MITEPDHSTIAALVRILRKSRSILFITGAGVSAESGIPTYRGIGGLYNVGTTSVFPYIQAPIHMGKSAGNVTVEINPSETIISHVVDYRLAMPAGAALDEIWNRYQASLNL